MKNLPLEFTQRMKGLLGEEYPQFEKALREEPQKAFRVNTEKISVEGFSEINPFGQEKIPYCDTGFYLNYEKIGNHPYHHAGLIYVQEPAAMVPAECLEIEPDWKILDMCAAPGGKSSQLKNKLGENGVLVSNEIVSSRCKILTGNIERLGLKNTVTTCMDTKRLGEVFPKTFDMIMVDAPCSGEGMFRKEENAITEWSLENVEKCAVRQKGILENAVKCLKDGGYIVYSTCTFSLEENEMMVDKFLSSHPDFEIVKVKEEVMKNTVDGIFFDGCNCKNISYSRRCYPHKTKGEGQFAAVLHNKNQAFPDFKSNQKFEKADKLVFEFLDGVLEEYNTENVIMYNGNPVYFTPDFKVNKGAAFSCGVTIGEIRKGYIQPHHQLFMALGDKFKRKINLYSDSQEVKKYLHGEEIEVSCDNGWAAVLVDGCTLGGAKVVNGTAKNHYPKGLRIKA